MEREILWELTVSPDKMQVQLCVTGEEHVDFDAILGALSDAGICHGIKEEALQEALQNHGIAVLAAEGSPAVEGTADSITFHIEERLLAGEIDVGIADDLYRTFKVPSVEVGERLVTRIPGTPGIEGKDVFGKPVKPPALPFIRLNPMPGTEVSEDGNTVLAAAAGRPRMDREANTYRFQVLPYFTHKGDLTIEAGYVSFQGDVTVLGNVMEGASVTASGTVEILGNVIGAKIVAGENIQIRGNVIQSRLSAGAGKMIWVEVTPLLDDLLLDLFDMAEVFAQLDERGQLGKKPFAQTASQVISLRFARYAETVAKITELVQRYKNAPVNAGAIDLATQVQVFFPENWTGRDDLQGAASKASELRELSKAGVKGGDITLPYALNAEIAAAGQILIRGQGSIHSRLSAGSTVQIHGKLRGGSVSAKTSIYAKETGSVAGASTILHVGSRGYIDMDKVYENTHLHIGKNTMKITETIGRSRAKLNQEARVELFTRK